MVPLHSDCPRARSPHQDLEDLNAGGLKEGWGQGLREAAEEGDKPQAWGFDMQRLRLQQDERKLDLVRKGFPKEF